MYCESLSHDQLLKNFAEFKATEESVKNDVQYLKQWMKTQPHLPDEPDEKFLICILMQSKNDIERAKVQAEKYYVARAKMPDVFSGRDPCEPWFRDFLDANFHMPLPKLTSEGHRVFILKQTDPSKLQLLTPTQYLKCCQMVVDVMMKEDAGTQVILIIDYENYSVGTMGFVLRITRQYIDLFSNVLKIRLKKIYILNTHPVVEPVLALARLFMKKKLVNRMVLWKKKPTDLVLEVPKEVLPREYGGDLKSLMELKDEYYKYICEFQSWFAAEENIKADLTKKPKGSVGWSFSSPSQATEGSLRQLDVD